MDNMRLVDEEIKNKIKQYVKLHHRKEHNWLQEHINKKFNIMVNLNTIRTWKRTMGCLTNEKQIKRQWVEYIRNNWKNKTDKELQENIVNKFGRNVSEGCIKKLRLKHHWFRHNPMTVKRGLTVKEIRICPNCGKEIKITCRNPNQKYCCKMCVAEYSRKNTYQRHLNNTTPTEVKTFMKTWLAFSKKVMYENRYSLTKYDLEDIQSEYYGIIPSIISGLKLRKLTREQHVKGYIAKAIRHLIFKKLRKTIDISKHEAIRFDDYERSDFIDYKHLTQCM